LKDCKQLLGLGGGRSETFDAVVAWASIVRMNYLILVYLLDVLENSLIDCPLEWFAKIIVIRIR
jgi:hypothetical protein